MEGFWGGVAVMGVARRRATEASPAARRSIQWATSFSLRHVAIERKGGSASRLPKKGAYCHIAWDMSPI